MDKASQESGSVSSGLVIVCLRCWDLVSSHATVTNIHLFGFHMILLQKLSDLPFLQLFCSSLSSSTKLPTQRHHQGKGDTGMQAALKLQPSQPRGWRTAQGPPAALQLHLQPTAWASAHRKPKSLTLC